jgi:hypothetical protein
MQLTDLGPIDGFALSRFHARLSVVEADGPARSALVMAARRLSPDGTVVLILGSDQADEVGAAIARRRAGASGARVRSAEGAVAATASRIGEQATMVVDGRARLAEFEEQLLRLTQASAEVERARASLGAAEQGAARARAAVDRVLAQRTEVDDAVRSVRERLANGEADDELEAQVAEVQRVLDQTEAERRARATDADLGVTLAESELRRVEDEMRVLHERIAGPDPGDAEQSLEERGERLRSRVLDAEQGCDRAEQAHRVALAAREDALRQAGAPEAVRAGPADVVRSLRAVGSLDARGPIPVLFDEPFALDEAAELAAALDELLELSRHTQVLYLTANPELLAWAKALPERSGSLVVPERPAPSSDPSTGREPIHT